MSGSSDQRATRSGVQWCKRCLASSYVDVAMSYVAGWRCSRCSNELVDKHVTPKVGVCVVVRRGPQSNPEILMGQRKGSHAAGTWSFPGGHLDLGETVEACGIREVKEETGIELSEVFNPMAYSHNRFEADGGKEYITLYLEAKVFAGTEAKLLEPTKCAGWVWVPRGKLPDPLFPSIPMAMQQFDLWRWK